MRVLHITWKSGFRETHSSQVRNKYKQVIWSKIGISKCASGVQISGEDVTTVCFQKLNNILSLG